MWSRYAAARSGFSVFAEMCIGKLVEPMFTMSPLSPGGTLKNTASSPRPSRTVAAFQLPAISTAPLPLLKAIAASLSFTALNASPLPRYPLSTHSLSFWSAVTLPSVSNDAPSFWKIQSRMSCAGV